MNNAKKKNIHIVTMGIASSFLLIYSVIRIVNTLSQIFVSNQMYPLSTLQMLGFIFFVNLAYLNYLVLALCGFILIYFAHFVKDETVVSKPAERAKVVIFSLLLALSVIYVIRVVFFTVISSGADIGIIDNIVYITIGLLTFTGGALFAILILRKIWNNSFRNAVVAVCIAGTAGGLLIRTIAFTSMMISFSGMWKYLLELAIAAATLSIIIFGLKISEQQNSSIYPGEAVSE